MGVDVTIIAKGSVTEEQIEEFNQFLKDRDGEHAASSFDMVLRRESVGYAERSEFDDRDWVDIHTLERYYGPGYERGNWPLIYATIIAARHHFPDATIHYGGDSGDEWELPEATDQELADIWTHWASKDGDAYRRPRRTA